MRVPSKNGQAHKTYIMDEYIEGNYTKFSNNQFIQLKGYEHVNEFSHWSFDHSLAKLMIVDLQGCRVDKDGQERYVLTDPAIHSPTRSFGETDLGDMGFLYFFMAHHRCIQNACNERLYS